MGQVMQQKTIINDELETEYHQIDYMPHDPACKVVVLDEGKPRFVPMICWQFHTIKVLEISDSVCVSPVTANGVADVAEYVVFPDGSVRHCDEVFDNVDDWLKEAIAWEEGRKARAAKRAAKREANREADREAAAQEENSPEEKP